MGGQRLSQTPDVDIDRPRVDIDVAPPDPVEQLFARPDPLGFFQKGREQPEFGRAKFQRIAVPAYPVGFGVKLATASLN